MVEQVIELRPYYFGKRFLIKQGAYENIYTPILIKLSTIGEINRTFKDYRLRYEERVSAL